MDSFNSFSQVISFDSDIVKQFAEITGDLNPIHNEEEFIGKSPFKEPIVHGFLAASVFSKILGMHLPGEGSIYLVQEMSFLEPIYFNLNYLAEVTVTHVDVTRSRVSLLTRIYSENGERICIDGKAVVKNVAWVKRQKS